MNKFKKLEVGQVVKNYKEMCIILNEEVLTSNSKKAQIKEWECHFSFRKQGHKFIIEDIYDESLDKKHNYTGRLFKIPLTESNPILSTEWNVDKNGELTNSITRTNATKYWWICRKCKKDIFESPKKRINKTKARTFGYTDECITCCHCNLSKGAKKIYDAFIKHNIKFEMEYTFEDLMSDKGNMLRFDFAIFDNEKLFSLVEYDGEHHDSSELIIYHDKMKNEYCDLNNIKLHRIHFSGNPQLLIYKYLLELGIISLDIYNEECLIFEIEELTRKLDYHKGKVEEIEKTILQKCNTVEVAF